MTIETLDLSIRSNWLQYDNDLFILYIALGIILSFYGVSGRFIKFYFLFTEPMGSLSLGFFLGNFFNLYSRPVLEPGSWFAEVTARELMLQLARLTLCIQIMSAALRLPRFFVIFAWRQLIVLFIFVMGMTMLSGALFGWALFGSYFGPQFGLAASLLLGALFCPTDPVVASSTVSGRFSEKRLSAGFRHLVSAESAGNDGITLPFVALPLLFVTGASTGEVMRYYWLKIILYDLLAAAIVAAIIGISVGWLVEQAERRPTDKNSFVAFALGFSIFILGLMRFFNAAALFAVFISGIGLVSTYPHHKLRHEDGQVQESFDNIVTCAFFFLLGVIFPFEEAYKFGWRGVILSLLLIFLRRPLWIFMSHMVLRPYLRSFFGEGLLYSYLAPMGVSTIFYGAWVSETLRNFGYPDTEFVDFFWVISMEVAVFSTYIQGFTLTGLTHVVPYFEKHKTPFYKALHLPPPHPLRGKLELPRRKHQGKEDQLQEKSYETRHSFGFFRNVRASPSQQNASQREGTSADGTETRQSSNDNTSSHTQNGNRQRTTSTNGEDNQQSEGQDEQVPNRESQHSSDNHSQDDDHADHNNNSQQNDGGEERHQRNRHSLEDNDMIDDDTEAEEEEEEREMEEELEHQKRVWAGRPLVGIFESSFWCRFLYRVDIEQDLQRDELMRV